MSRSTQVLRDITEVREQAPSPPPTLTFAPLGVGVGWDGGIKRRLSCWLPTFAAGFFVETAAFLEEILICSSDVFVCPLHQKEGYGHISPETDGGKFACIAYAGVGIPLMLLLLADLGDLLAAILSKCYGTVQKFCSRKGPGQPSSNLSKRFSSYRITKRKDTTSKPEPVLPMNRRVVVFKEPLNITEVMKTQTLMNNKSAILRNKEIFEKIVAQQRLKLLTIHNLKLARCRSCPELDQIPQVQHAIEDFDKIGKELNKLNVPICLIAFIVVAYTLCGASILLIWEKDWNYVDAFYFCFITLTTIGFGDIFPNHPNYFLGLSVYTVIGMAIMVMAFKLGQDRLVGCYKQSISCISGGKARKYSKV